MRQALVVVASMVLLMLGYRQYQQERAQREALAAMRAETQELRAALGARRTAWVPAPAEARPAAVVEPEREPAEPPEVGLPPVPEPEDAQARLEARYTSEPSEPGWSRASEDALRATLPTVLPAGSTIQEITCRSTLCRLSIVHQQAGAVDQFARDALMGGTPIWRGPVTMAQERREDGSAATVMYLSRNEY
jgi:hypothetical protein